MSRPLLLSVLCAAFAAVPVLLADQTPDAQKPVFRASTDVVTVDVSVRSGSDRIAGLKPSDFIVTDNGVPQHVDQVESSIVPVDVTVLAETDDTVADEADSINRQATRIAGMVRPIDRVRVWDVSSVVTEIVPLGAMGPRPAIPTMPGGGLASVYDGIAAALMEPVAPDGRHLIVAITNGVDTSSVLSLDTVREIAARSNATLHVSQIDVVEHMVESDGAYWVTAYEDSSTSPWRIEPTHKFWLPHYTPPEGKARFDSLADIATSTGGKLHTLGLIVEHNAADVFTNAFRDMQTNYVLRYTPQGVAKDGWHDIVVKVPEHSGYLLHARRGYSGDEVVAGAPAVPAAVASTSPIDAALQDYAHEDYSQLFDVIARQPSLAKFMGAMRNAGDVFPTAPRREAVMALEFAQRGFASRQSDAQAQASQWLADEGKLVEPVLGPDTFEHDWRAAELALLEAQVNPTLMRPFVDAARSRFPEDAAFLLADAIVTDQAWPIGTENVMTAAAASRHAQDVIAKYEAVAGHAEARPIAAEARVREAWLLHRLKRNADALPMLEAIPAKDLDPSMSFLRDLFRGHVLLALGRPADAVAAFRAASTRFPTASSAQTALMNALLAAGDQAAAVALAAEVQTMTPMPNDPWHLYWQGDYRTFPTAIAHLREMAK